MDELLELCRRLLAPSARTRARAWEVLADRRGLWSSCRLAVRHCCRNPRPEIAGRLIECHAALANAWLDRFARELHPADPAEGERRLTAMRRTVAAAVALCCGTGESADAATWAASAAGVDADQSRPIHDGDPVEQLVAFVRDLTQASHAEREFAADAFRTLADRGSEPQPAVRFAVTSRDASGPTQLRFCRLRLTDGPPQAGLSMSAEAAADFFGSRWVEALARVNSYANPGRAAVCEVERSADPWRGGASWDAALAAGWASAAARREWPAGVAVCARLTAAGTFAALLGVFADDGRPGPLALAWRDAVAGRAGVVVAPGAVPLVPDRAAWEEHNLFWIVSERPDALPSGSQIPLGD